jgi:hypothetical protein
MERLRLAGSFLSDQGWRAFLAPWSVPDLATWSEGEVAGGVGSHPWLAASDGHHLLVPTGSANASARDGCSRHFAGAFPRIHASSRLFRGASAECLAARLVEGVMFSAVWIF